MAVLSYVPPLDAPWITRGGASTTTVCKPAVIRHRVSCWRLGAGLEFDRRLAVRGDDDHQYFEVIPRRPLAGMEG